MQVGAVVSHYRISGKLGQGGMGVVYSAEDTRLGREVALKFVPENQRDEQARERLQREARAASALNHPNICTIYDVGEHEGEYFIAMELLQGETLQQRLWRGSLPLDMALEIGIQLSDALQAEHSKGILHRDIKRAWAGQADGFRPGAQLACGGREQGFGPYRQPGRSPPDKPRDGAGHGGLHVARAGARGRTGRALRSVFTGGGALRNHNRARALPGEQHGADLRRHSEPGAGTGFTPEPEISAGAGADPEQAPGKGPGVTLPVGGGTALGPEAAEAGQRVGQNRGRLTGEREGFAPHGVVGRRHSLHGGGDCGPRNLQVKQADRACQQPMAATHVFCGFGGISRALAGRAHAGLHSRGRSVSFYRGHLREAASRWRAGPAYARWSHEAEPGVLARWVKDCVWHG